MRILPRPGHSWYSVPMYSMTLSVTSQESSKVESSYGLMADRQRPIEFVAKLSNGGASCDVDHLDTRLISYTWSPIGFDDLKSKCSIIACPASWQLGCHLALQ
jgi:hypothetical protein